MFRCLAVAGAAGLLAVGAPAAAQDDPPPPPPLTIGTANAGGPYFEYGQGWADLAAAALERPVRAVVTGGSVHNATLVQIGELDFALVSLGPALEALRGDSGVAPGLEHTALRALFPMYPTPFQLLVLAGSGIESLEDLNGLTIGVGPAGGMAALYWPRMLDALGVRASIRHGSLPDLGRQLEEDLIDAFAFASGIPTGIFAQLAANHPVRLVGVTAEERDRVLAALPALSPFTLPAGLYEGMEAPVDSVAMWNVAITHASVPDDLAEAMVAAALESPEALGAALPAAADTVAENHPHNIVLPWHPGAARWFAGQGIALRDPVPPPAGSGSRPEAEAEADTADAEE